MLAKWSGFFSLGEDLYGTGHRRYELVYICTLGTVKLGINVE